MGDLASGLERLKQLSVDEQASFAAAVGGDLTDAEVKSAADETKREWLGSLLSLVEAGQGSCTERLSIGEFLARLGDPRLLTPSDPDYWVTVTSAHGDITIARFQVTNHEYQEFVSAGGYENKSLWSEEGWEWLEGCPDPWPVRAKESGSAPFVIANQPVVGVSAHEAFAYARFRDARLPSVDERVWVVRGEARRPYPWGSPFGEGNANTVEEVLGRPCAVGLYLKDRTPEGVWDLAGNAGEWTGDKVGHGYLIHPGAWDQPSLAAWAKALTVEHPDSRWAGLGFRLARD